MKSNLVFLAVLYVTHGFVLTPVMAKTCADYGLTVKSVCGEGGVIPPHPDCEKPGVTCKYVDCPTTCYCLPTTASCPSSGSTTTLSCSGAISWGEVSSGLQIGVCENKALVYRCSQRYYFIMTGTAPRPPRPGSAYSSTEITCNLCPGGRPSTPRPGVNGINTLATTPGIGIYEITQCYIPMNSDMFDVFGTYQFKDQDCSYTE